MDGFISREAARSEVLKWADGYSYIEMPTENAIAQINAIPASDVVEVRHAHWILHISDIYPADSTMECSSCNEEQLIGTSDKFCPNCGAKMDDWKWCIWQDEDNEGVYCTAHIHEGRVLNCPYKNLEERQREDYPCQDYRPMNGGQDA